MDNNLLIEAMRTAANVYPAVKAYLSADALEMVKRFELLPPQTIEKLKHYGPGDHDNGSPQEVHAGDGEGSDSGISNPSIGKTGRGDEVYKITNAENLMNDYKVVAVSVSGNDIIGMKRMEAHAAMIEAVRPDKTVDDYVRLVAYKGKLEASINTSGVIVSNDDDKERAINNIYKSLDRLVSIGLPESTGVVIWTDSRNSYEITAKSIFLLLPSEFKSYDYMLSTITRMVNQVYSNNMGGEFVDILGALIRGQMRDAYRTAYADAGFSDALPDWLQASLEEQITKQASFDYIYRFYTDIIDARVDGTPIAPLLVRAQLWANRYNEAMAEANTVITAKLGGRLVWKLGETEQHCTSCAALNGIVAFATEWELSGVKPQNAPNDRLECEGWQCDCRMEPTNKRRSPNAWDRIMSVNA